MVNIDTNFTKKQIIIALCGLLFFISFLIFLILVLSNNKEVLEVDNNILNFLVNVRGEKGGFLFIFFRIIAEFGFVYILIFIYLLLLIYTKLDIRFIVLLLGIGIALTTNVILKNIIERLRPEEYLRWQNETSYSFPSSHSLSSGFIYTYIAYLLAIDNKMNKILKIIFITFSIIIIPLIMFSRLILAVHYFTDVMAGVSLGVFYAFLGMFVTNIFIKKEILKTPLLIKLFERKKDIR